MHETGYSGLVHWDDPEGWDRGREWEGVSGWGTHVHQRLKKKKEKERMSVNLDYKIRHL